MHKKGHPRDGHVNGCHNVLQMVFGRRKVLQEKKNDRVKGLGKGVHVSRVCACV